MPPAMPRPSRRQQPPRLQRGVTLAELTAVVLVLATVAAAAVMNADAVDEAKSAAAASGVAAALRFARDESLRTGTPHGVGVNPTQGRVRVFRADTGAVPHSAVFDVRDPLSKKLYDLKFADEPELAGVTLTRTHAWRGACNDTSRIVFRDAATPACLDPAGVLLDSAEITLTRGSASHAVKLEGFTARVWTK